jgi:leucyl/phenylalanyl-tRNA--protein transferase
MIPLLGPADPFPAVDTALAEPNGLLAVGADLGVARLLDAYAHGIFPWFNAGDPILWWSPDPRMVLFGNELVVSRSLGKRLRRHDYRVTADRAFTAVVRGCSAPRDGEPGTWIVPAMRRAYERLHAAGFAHSIEVWVDDALVGGLYGVAVGRMFFGESMFARRTDASKVALAHLVAQLTRWRFPLIDCQMSTPHLASLGARDLPRHAFLALLRPLTTAPHTPGPWTLDDDLRATWEPVRAGD